MAVTENQIADCVAHYRRLVDKRPASPPESLAQTTRSGLQKIIVRAGAKRRSDGLLVQLEDAFTAAGIGTYPRLTDPKNTPDERIHLFDLRYPLADLSVQKQRFPRESSLREYLLANLHEFAELRGLTGVQKEKRMPSGRKLDVVGRRSRLGELVGIELKQAGIDFRAVGQSLQYIDDLAAEAARQGLVAHFILLTSGPSNPAAYQRIQRHADERGVKLDVLLYSFEMTLRPHP